jgi:hypothetical protein
MSIKADINEIEGIEAELKTIRARAKVLRLRKKELEARVGEYLETKETPGVKYQGKEYRLHEKTTRASKKAKDRDLDAIYVLEKYGIREADIVLKELLEARKGEEVQSRKIKIKKVKKKNY